MVGVSMMVLVVDAKNLPVIRVVPSKTGEIFVQLNRVALPE
jgi:hypothetical protein